MSIRISKRQFIEKLSRRLNCENEEAAIIYNQFLNLIIEELIADNKIIFTGFGSFEIKAHKGLELQFGKKTPCRDYRVLTFKVSNILKQRINQK